MKLALGSSLSPGHAKTGAVMRIGGTNPDYIHHD
jgi:hypothetical protein